MKIISFNTMYINYEKKYNPNSQILLAYPDDGKRLLDICTIIVEYMSPDTIVCLQECSSKLIDFLMYKLDTSYAIFSQQIDEDVFMVTIAHKNLSFKIVKSLTDDYRLFAHGYLVISNDTIKIINCHLMPKFVAKKNVFSIIKNSSPNDMKCIIAGDFNEKYKNITNQLQDYTIPFFGATYKKNKGIDHIVCNFQGEFHTQKIDTYSVSDHLSIILNIN